MGGDGGWTNAVAAATFVVPPMWYQTRVFYAALAVAVALAVWGTWKVRISQIRRRFAAVLGERARVGREIHDTLLQSLVGMALQLDTLADESERHPGTLRESLGRIRRQVEHYIGEAQQSIWELRSPRLESSDLAGRLRERAGRILKDAGIGFEFSVIGEVRNLASHVDQQMLRIGIEAVVNAVRHAQARNVRVELMYEGDSVRLRVTDDGHGFNPEAVHSGGESHWGLSIMRERAEQVGGRFAVASAPDRGTSIEIVAPYGVPA
jgi:signal transduction histidine kinase